MNQEGNSEFVLSIAGTSTGGQFYVADLVVVQYACASNCAVCSFSTLQATTCTSCKPFYSLNDNCRTCANGFFEANSACVKCYSNCKQCFGAESNQCTQCFDNFELTDINYNQTCITCLHQNPDQVSLCTRSCPVDPNQVSSNANCTACLRDSMS